MGTQTQFHDFKGIFDFHPSPSVLISCEGEILYANQAMAETLGAAKDDLKGRYFSSLLGEPFTRESFSFYKSRLKGNRIYEPLSVFLDGSSDTEWSMHLYYLNDQKIFQATFIPQQIKTPGLHSLGQNISHKSEEYKIQKLREGMDHLIYIIGHDLRAPMRAILGFSQIIRDSYMEALEGEGIELLEIIRTNTRKLNSLVINLVDFSRLSNTVETHIPVHLGELFQYEFEKLHSMQPQLREIEFELGELKIIKSDPGLIKTIVVELLSNAIKFSQDIPIASISVGGYVDAHGYTFYVRDNGIGFNMDDSDRVFGIFEKLVLEEDYPGNGIGLARVYKAVQMLNGRVWTQAEPAKGATFFVFLPQ